MHLYYKLVGLQNPNDQEFAKIFISSGIKSPKEDLPGLNSSDLPDLSDIPDLPDIPGFQTEQAIHDDIDECENDDDDNDGTENSYSEEDENNEKSANSTKSFKSRLTSGKKYARSRIDDFIDISSSLMTSTSPSNNFFYLWCNL